MRIGLAQINPAVGDIEGNRKKIIDIAISADCELVVFPELSVVGYCPQDLILKKQFVDENIASINIIAETIKNKKVIAGFIDRKDGELYNSAVLIKNRKIEDVYHKQCLPNYSVFDEKRWFKPGRESKVFSVNGRKIGLNICEDIWGEEVCKKQSHADFFINISASPYSTIKIGKIEDVLLERYRENKKRILYVNQVGAQDGLIYYGHSMLVENGKIAKRAKDFEEDFLIVNL